MMKKRITAILAAAVIAVGASVPAFADSDFYTAANDAQVLLTAQEAQADTALDTLDTISDDSAAVVLSDNYDTAAINHGPHASARAVMAQQIPHQEEAQVSLQDGVEQIDVDRQYCVEKGADRGGEDNEEEKQGQLSARAGVCDPLQKGSRQIDPHHRIDEPHVVALAAVQQGGEKGIKGNRHSCAQGIGKQIDQVPGA